MSEPFVGEIRMFAGNFAPLGWAFCDGQLLAVSSYNALFSLLGTTFGGDGRTTFGLPDMRGRLPVHPGSGPGLTSRLLGHKWGSEQETLSVNQIPNHTHAWEANSGAATGMLPAGNTCAQTTTNYYQDSVADMRNMEGSMVENTGGSSSHSNLMPYLVVNFIIALVGVYPSRH